MATPAGLDKLLYRNNNHNVEPYHDYLRPPIFRLLDLPPELRERIYYHCLVVPVALIILKPIDSPTGLPSITGPKSFKLTHITDDTPPKPNYIIPSRSAHAAATVALPPPTQSSINLNLLVLNKAIYAEALPVLYHENALGFAPWGPQSPWPALAQFCATVPTRNLALVRQLSIRFRPPDDAAHSFIFIFNADSDPLLRLPNLRHLRLTVHADLAARDLTGLRKIRDAQRCLGVRWRVSFRVGRTKDRHDPRRWRVRDPTVEQIVVDTFRDWGWELLGDYDVEKIIHE